MSSIRNKNFMFTIEGKDVSPETVTFHDLVDILTNLEVAVSITAKSQGAKEQDDLNFSLIDVSKGSDVLTLAVSDKMLRAAGVVSESIKKDDFSKIPKTAYGSIRALWRKSNNSGWSLGFIPDGNGIVKAAISPQKELLKPERFSGRAVIYGKCDRVGGEDSPTAKIVLLSGQRQTISIKSRELAEELGELLFQVVGLEGEASWDTENWKLFDFKADTLVQYTAGNVQEAFEKLASVAGNHWDDVDPDEYVRELRSD